MTAEFWRGAASGSTDFHRKDAKRAFEPKFSFAFFASLR